MISCPGLTLIGLSGTAQDQPLPCSRHSDRRARTKNYDFSWWTIIFLMGGGVGWCWKVFTCKRYGSWCWLTKSGLFGNACGFRTDSLACLWVLTSFVPSPLKFPVCHESKLHTKWLLSVSGKERVWWNRATTTCDLTQKRLVYPLHRDLVHSFRRYESAWFVIAGDMPFPCLCRCKMQSFRNDARRETHNEVCLLLNRATH